MAQKVVVHLVDDLDGGTADETLQFAIDGNHYEIDLSTENAKKFRQTFAHYVEPARRVRQNKRAASTTAPKSRTKEIRAWAQENGYQLSSRGRVHAHIIEAYDKAHQNA